MKYCCDELREMLEYQQTPDDPVVCIDGGVRVAVKWKRRTVPYLREFRLKFCPFCATKIRKPRRAKE